MSMTRKVSVRGATFVVASAVVVLLAAACTPPAPGVPTSIPVGKCSAAPVPGVDLSGCYLREVQWPGVNLRNANLDNADLQGAHLHGATLTGADLTGANLYLADMSSVI